MKAGLRIAIAQVNVTVGKLEANQELAAGRIEEARRLGCGLVVFPELTLTGYPPEDLLFKKHFITANLAELAALTPKTKGICAVVGFVDRDAQGRIYNAAAVLNHGNAAGVYHKICLPNYGVFDEKRYFTPGSQPLILDTSWGRIAVSICEDLWPDDSPYLRRLAGSGTDLIVNASASPYHFGKIAYRKELMKRRAASARAYLAYANLVGGQDELVFDGSSFILDKQGREISSGAAFAEDLMIYDLPPPETAQKTHLQGSGVRIELKGRPIRRKNVSAKPRGISPEEEIYRALVLGTRDYVLKNGFQKVTVGLSGGIDSALVAVIAADAIGPKNVVGVTMPSEFSSKGTLADALGLAKNLGMPCHTLSIEPLRKAYAQTLGGVFKGTKTGAAEENLQARIRGNLLMALSNKFGYLVLTTGNKSELATGYCTLYGDMAGGFAVIKDIPKTMVYRLVRWRNASAKKPVIPQSIVKRPPTAELRANQRDTDSLPEYSVLDPILELYVEKDASLADIAGKGHPTAAAKSVIRKVDINEYKRRQAPPGVKITPKAFGRDRRMPITNAFPQ